MTPSTHVVRPKFRRAFLTMIGRRRVNLWGQDIEVPDPAEPEEFKTLRKQIETIDRGHPLGGDPYGDIPEVGALPAQGDVIETTETMVAGETLTEGVQAELARNIVKMQSADTVERHKEIFANGVEIHRQKEADLEADILRLVEDLRKTRRVIAAFTAADAELAAEMKPLPNGDVAEVAVAEVKAKKPSRRPKTVSPAAKAA